MIDKDKLKKILILVVVLICILLILKFLFKSQAKYQTEANSNGNIDVAFYLLKEEFSSMDLSLDDIEPRDKPYVYNFTISNTDGKNRTETSLEYNLNIRTTTNLPLTFELYMNQEYSSLGAQSVISTNEVIQDDDGTYFREITTEKQNFGFEKDETNTYQLVVYFPSEYVSILYQDIIEGIEINVDSKQMIE